MQAELIGRELVLESCYSAIIAGTGSASQYRRVKICSIYAVVSQVIRLRGIPGRMSYRRGPERIAQQSILSILAGCRYRHCCPYGYIAVRILCWLKCQGCKPLPDMRLSDGDIGANSDR